MTKVEHRKEAVRPVEPFATVEEEAEFWDSHSVVEAIAKGTLVGFRRAKKTDTLTVRFEPSDLQRIREVASQRGVGPTTLVRMWVREHLRASDGHPDHSPAPDRSSDHL
jgi:predicted DNA binding CopG/RHH family protein